MACLMWHVQDAGPLPVARDPSVRFRTQDPRERHVETRLLRAHRGSPPQADDQQHLSRVVSEVCTEFLSVYLSLPAPP